MSNIEDRPPPETAPWRVVVWCVGSGLALAMGFAYWHRPPPPAPIALPAVTVRPDLPAEGTRGAMLAVHVSGAVQAPGLVALPEGSRVADAIAAAGGARPGGRLGEVNLAARVTDGMHLVVPWSGGDAPRQDRGTGTQDGRVDVNRAGADELTALPGVGEVLAARIEAYRETHGPFAVLEDLLDVPGIGEGKLAGLRDYAVVRP